MSSAIQVVMIDVLQPAFEQWLATRGLLLQRTPFLDDEDGGDVLPTYLVTPHPDQMERFNTTGPDF